MQQAKNYARRLDVPFAYSTNGIVLSADAHEWAPTPGKMDLLGKEIPAGLYKMRQFVGDTHRSFLGSVASATAHPRAPLVRFDRSCGGFQPGVREQAA